MVYWRRGKQAGGGGGIVTDGTTPPQSPATRPRRRVSFTGTEGTPLLNRIISPFRSNIHGVEEQAVDDALSQTTSTTATATTTESSNMIAIHHANNTPSNSADASSRPMAPVREMSCRKLASSASKMMARIVPNHVQEDEEDSDTNENPAVDSFCDELPQQGFTSFTPAPTRPSLVSTRPSLVAAASASFRQRRESLSSPASASASFRQRRESLSSPACNFDFTAITRQLSTAKLTISRRVAVVTGANRGIGFYTAVRLADSGKFDVVVLACRNPNRGFRAVRKLMKVGQIATSATKVVHMPLLVGDEESHASFARVVEERYGHIDLLVNNAGTASKANSSLSEEEQCRHTFDVNFRGTVDLTEELLPLLRRAPRGQVINVVSEAGRLDQLRSEHLRDQFSSAKLSMLRLRGLIDQYERDAATGMAEVEGWGTSNYAMSKLALIAATRIWARQEDDDPKSKVVVNCCSPGFCKTDLNSRMGDRTPWFGSKMVLKPAFMKKPPTGEFFCNMLVTEW